MEEALIYEVLSVVEEIPVGRVAAYGQIAMLIGRERNARLVGKILGMSEYYGQYPATGWSTTQAGLLCTGRNSGSFSLRIAKDSLI